MSRLLLILRGLESVRLTAVGAVMLGVFGFLIYLMSQTTNGNVTLLFPHLDPADMGKILEKLKAIGIPVKVEGDGASIHIPSEKVAQARMGLAQEEIPWGIVGDEIFDRNDLLNTSSNMMDVHKLRVLEGEFAKSIKTIPGVAAARVHIVIPKRDVYSRDETPPSAAIILKLKGMTKLSGSQVQSIQYLIASAVPSLLLDKISMMDDKGNLLVKGVEGENGMQGLLLKQEIKHSYESKLAKSIEELIEKTVGNGKARVKISSEMDIDLVTINTEQYDPEGQMIRSTYNVEEDASLIASGNQSISGQSASSQNQAKNRAPLGNKNKRNKEDISYEISRIVESHRKESDLKSLSVAVLVDGNYTSPNGKLTYSPRSKKDLDQIKLLVQTAIGFKAGRGDKIEVINMPFAPITLVDEASQVWSNQWFSQMDKTKIIEFLGLIAVGILVLLRGVSPIILRVIKRSEIINGEVNAQILLPLVHGKEISTLPDYGQATATFDSYTNDNEENEDMMVRVQNVEGRLSPSSFKKIGEVIDKHPDEAMTILRS